MIDTIQDWEGCRQREYSNVDGAIFVEHDLECPIKIAQV